MTLSFKFEATLTPEQWKFFNKNGKLNQLKLTLIAVLIQRREYTDYKMDKTASKFVEELTKSLNRRLQKNGATDLTDELLDVSVI